VLESILHFLTSKLQIVVAKLKAQPLAPLSKLESLKAKNVLLRYKLQENEKALKKVQVEN